MATGKESPSWKAVESRNAGIDKGVPAHGSGHVDRGRKLEASIQKGQEQRRAGFSNVKPVQPAANALPAITNRPAASDPKLFKKQG
jgi:hypothetical protein